LRKVFLSHSSNDKYLVDNIAKRLGENIVNYDSFSFEISEEIVKEVLSRMDLSDIFVFFISENSLTLKDTFNWIEFELKNAETRLKNSTYRCFVPILIDKTIKYNDSRIPKWIQDKYNIKYVGNWDKIVRLITTKIIEFTWALNPLEKKRISIFAGRTNYIRDIETRLYSGKKTPKAIIASGFNRIGRKSIVYNSFIKFGIIDDYSYIPIHIDLNRDDSIEDFIIKLIETGNSENNYTISDLSVTMDQKIEIAITLMLDIVKYNDFIFITDYGCIVNTENATSEWFSLLISKIPEINKTVLIVASIFRIFNYFSALNNDDIYYFQVQALDQTEITILLNKLLQHNEIEISQAQKNVLIKLFKGFPEQIYYTVNLLKSNGYDWLLSNSFHIIDYNNEKASSVIKDLNEEELNFLRFLCEFECISLLNLFDDNKQIEISNHVNKLLGLSICFYYGPHNEFIIVDSAIKDLMQRKYLKINDKYKPIIDSYIDRYKKNESITDYDSFYIGSKNYLIVTPENKIDFRKVLPSTYLKAIIELYHKTRNRYDDIVKLSYLVLEKGDQIDKDLQREIRYWLCMSLAKSRDSRFHEELMKISGPEHNYILGYYYRINGKNKEAEIKLLEAIKQRSHFPRAKTELVHVYLNSENYEKAYIIAKENYNESSNNIYNLASYFRACLRTLNYDKDELKRILEKLSKYGSAISIEMYYNCLSQYLAFVEHDFTQALDAITKGISLCEKDVYLRLTEVEIYIKSNNAHLARESLAKMSKDSYINSYLNNTLKIKEAQILSLENNCSEAISIIDSLINFSEEAKSTIKSKLRSS